VPGPVGGQAPPIRVPLAGAPLSTRGRPLRFCFPAIENGVYRGLVGEISDASELEETRVCHSSCLPPPGLRLLCAVQALPSFVQSWPYRPDKQLPSRAGVERGAC
jgi:hypothetical protein